MGETSISWTNFTFNTWWGCFKISPGCANCYAASFDRRVHGKGTDHWERTGSRWFQSDEYWQQPLKWDAKAARAGVRKRVFCGSMCDWAEQHPNPEIHRQMDAYRGRLFELIQRTQHLDWLLLTKRPEHVVEYLPWVRRCDAPWPNVWIGTTVEDQEHADLRVPVLLEIAAAVHFLSCEPLLGPVDLTRIRHSSVHGFDALAGVTNYPVPSPRHNRVTWVIAGAESGHRARACDVAWLRALRDQCAGTDTAFFLKQAVWRQPITIGIGSRTKGKGHNHGAIVELPYLDGVQHAALPEAHVV